MPYSDFQEQSRAGCRWMWRGVCASRLSAITFPLLMLNPRLQHLTVTHKGSAKHPFFNLSQSSCPSASPFAVSLDAVDVLTSIQYPVRAVPTTQMIT